MSFYITRKEAEAIVNNTQHCLIHDRPMTEYGQPDLCGTYPTFCQMCNVEDAFPSKGTLYILKSDTFNKKPPTEVEG